MNNNKVIKASLWYVIGSFLTKGMSFIVVPFIVRVLTKEEYGLYSTLLTWVSLFSILSSFSFYASINKSRFVFAGEINKYCSSVLVYSSLFTLLLYFVVLLFFPLFESLIKLDPIYIHGMFLYLIVQPAMEIFQIKQRVVYKYRTSVLVSIISSVSSLIFSVLLAYVLSDGLFGASLGHFAPVILFCIALYFYLMINGQGFSFKYFKFAFFYSWPFVIHLFASYILSSSDKIMITDLIGAEANASYSIACSCMLVVSVVMTSINNAISPWIFDKLKENNFAKLRSITIPYLLVLFLPSILFLFIVPEFIFVLGGGKYQDAVNSVPPLIVSVLFNYAYCLYVNVEQYSGKTWAIALGTILASTANIVLNFLLLPKLGYVVAAYTTLIGYILLFVVHYIFVRIIGYKNVYNDKVVFGFLCISLVLIPAFDVLYDNFSIRIVLFVFVLLLILFFAFFYRKRISNFMPRKHSHHEQ